MGRRIEAWVTGRVQGVWFRAFTAGEARELGVTGFVENLPDGRVHLVAHGAPEAVDELLKRVQTGPPGSRVDELAVADAPEGVEFSGFSIRH